MSNTNMNRQLGTKWFTFYTKVRPWFSLVMALSVIGEFAQYTEVYLNNLGALVYFIATIIYVVLNIMVFVKSSDDYVEFVNFVEGVLFFETIYFAFQIGMNAYNTSDFDLGYAFVMFAIAAAIDFFLWFRLNIKYFEKRILSSKGEPSTKIITSTDTFAYTGSKDQIGFCSKCGEKLLDGSRFCGKCGAEIVEVPTIILPNTEVEELCKKCGADITSDIDTCHVCGAKIDN